MRHIFSITGVSVLRMAVISADMTFACSDDILSVVDQLRPSIKGGMPVRATNCSSICLTGTSLSST